METILSDRGLPGDFGRANVYDAPEDSGFEFDIVATTAGAAVVAATYFVAGALIRSKHPVGILVGGAILVVPDVVMFAAGYSMFD